MCRIAHQVSDEKIALVDQDSSTTPSLLVWARTLPGAALADEGLALDSGADDRIMGAASARVR